jgi:hypothetical protein
MATQKLNLTRDQLATFLKDHEQIKQFEALFKLVDAIAPDVVLEINILAGSALSVANEALSVANELSQEVNLNNSAIESKVQQTLDVLQSLVQVLELLTLAPRPELGTLAPQNYNRVNITGGKISGLDPALPVDSGGTGQSLFADGQLLIGNSTGNTLSKSTLTPGANITITNGAGSITIAVSGLGSMAFENTGATGTFTTVDLKTVSVTNGIITSIV